jgi:hypothetical protein
MNNQLCGNCGNALFDQGLGTLYCGCCGYQRKKLLPLNKQMIERLKGLDVSSVESTYSGKPGCMCGCRGKYTEGLNKAIVKNMIATIEQGYEGDLDFQPSQYLFVEAKSPTDGEVNRYYAVYFKKEATLQERF